LVTSSWGGNWLWSHIKGKKISAVEASRTAKKEQKERFEKESQGGKKRERTACRDGCVVCGGEDRGEKNEVSYRLKIRVCKDMIKKGGGEMLWQAL